MSRWITPWLVRVLQRLRRLARDAERVLHRELPLAPEPVAERLALHVRHGEPQPAARRPSGLPGVQHGQDVGMLQPGGEPDLALEALRAERLPQLGMEHLEGDGAVVLEVAGEIDRGHAAAAELALEQ